MNWEKFNKTMGSIESEIRSVTCNTAPTIRQRLDTCSKKLLEEQTNYAMGSAAYLKRLNELFKSLHHQKCLIPVHGDEGAIFTYFDELVKHSMIAGNMSVLETWGIQPFMATGVQAYLKYPREACINMFNYKAQNGRTPASARYYNHLAQAFTTRLRN